MGDFKLCKKSEVPKLLQMPYIKGGYRPTPCTALFCIQSMFQMTNETFNFWTHFIPFLLMLQKTCVFFSNNSWEPINYPIIVYLLGVCFVLLASSIAHLFNSCSVRCFCCCFSSDLGAVLMYGFTLQIALEHYVCPVTCFGVVGGQSREDYHHVAMYYCTIQILSACMGYLPKVSKSIRSAAYFIGLLMICTPCFLRYYYFNVENETSKCWKFGKESSHIFFVHVSFIIIGSIFYATRFPERLFPGKFDFIGNSHQFFHLFTAAAMFVGLSIFESALKEAKEQISKGVIDEKYLDISWKSTLGNAINMFCITYFIVIVFNLLVNYYKSIFE